MANRQIVTALNSSSLGDIKALLATVPENSKDVVILGTLFGKARAISFRANPQDPDVPTKALVGLFEGVPADPNGDVIQSTRCYIQPKNVHDMICALVQGAQDDPIKKAPPKGKSVELAGAEVVPFTIEVGVRRSNSPVGYEYVGTVLNDDPDVQDDLSEMRKALPKDRRRTIAGGRLEAPTAHKALPAPTKAKKKARK